MVTTQIPELGTRFEVHFHQQYEASASFETNAQQKMIAFAEIASACCLANRQMVNLSGTDAGTSIARVLLRLAQKPGILTSSQLRDEPRLVPYAGAPGRKRFLTTLEMGSKGVRFNLQAKGFGLFARGVGFYAAHSVMILVRQLIKRNGEDGEYRSALSNALGFCGQAQLAGELSLTNQFGIALNATDLALSEVCEFEEEDKDIGLVLVEWIFDQVVNDVEVLKDLALEELIPELLLFRSFCVDFAVYCYLGGETPDKNAVLDLFYGHNCQALSQVKSIRDPTKELESRLAAYTAAMKAPRPFTIDHPAYNAGKELCRVSGRPGDMLLVMAAVQMFTSTWNTVGEILEAHGFAILKEKKPE